MLHVIQVPEIMEDGSSKKACVENIAGCFSAGFMVKYGIGSILNVQHMPMIPKLNWNIKMGGKVVEKSSN